MKATLSHQATTSLLPTEPARANTEQQMSRQKSIELHMKLLSHASSCCPDCSSKNCIKMKDFLNHYDKERNPNECVTCKRVKSMLMIHSLSCLNHVSCPVLDCTINYKKEQEKIKDAQKVATQNALEHAKKASENTENMDMKRVKKSVTRGIEHTGAKQYSYLAARIGRFAANDLSHKIQRHKQIMIARTSDETEENLSSLFQNAVSV